MKSVPVACVHKLLCVWTHLEVPQYTLYEYKLDTGNINHGPVDVIWDRQQSTRNQSTATYKRWLKHRCTIYFYSSYFSIFVIEKLTSGNWTLSFRRNRISLGHHFWRCWNNWLFIIIANEFCSYNKESESTATNLQLTTMVVLDQNTCHGWWKQYACNILRDALELS